MTTNTKITITFYSDVVTKRPLMERPANFPGTREEIEANYATHSFDAYYERCVLCDCRPWGYTAEWPCGTEPPRVTETIDEYTELATREYMVRDYVGGLRLAAKLAGAYKKGFVRVNVTEQGGEMPSFFAGAVEAPAVVRAWLTEQADFSAAHRANKQAIADAQYELETTYF